MIPSARRHAIKINDISAFKPTFRTSTMRSRELISSPVKHIAVFCNEYIPEHFPEGKYITYILTVNGIDHEIVPINNQRNGTKIIRTVTVDAKSDSVLHIAEPIKSAVLTIKIESPDKNQSPYISGIKILMGGDS